MFFPTSRTLSDVSDLDLRTDRVYNQTNVPIIRYQDYNLICHLHTVLKRFIGMKM